MPSVVLANGCSMRSREFIDRYVFAPPWPTSVNIAPRAAGNMLRRAACGAAVVCAACAAVATVVFLILLAGVSLWLLLSRERNDQAS